MMISTPCRKTCQTDSQRAYCQVCKRSVDEIVNWRAYTETQRKKIMAELPGRDIELGNTR